MIIGLREALEYGRDVIQKAAITEDFAVIIESISNATTRTKPLDLEQMSVVSRGFLTDFSQDNAYLKHIDQEFVQVLNFFLERPPENWCHYEIFEKTFLKNEAP